MTEYHKIIPKDSLFIITEGDYSDYQTIALCRALEDIKPKELQEEYLEKREDQRGDYSLKKYEVINWMVNIRKCVEELNFFELHLGDYGAADFDIFTEKHK